jgi:protein-disulfide isomerase/uncharacterized membrane protein
MQKQLWNWVALICVLIGIVISTYLVVHHYNLIFGLTETKSFCTVSSKIDCDAVNTSTYSTLLGVPVAMIQDFVLLVALLLLLGLRAFGESEKPAIGRFLFYLATTNLVATLVMGTISSLVLKVFCTMCMSLYIVAIVLWFSSLKVNAKGVLSHLGSDLKNLLRSGEEGTRGFLILFLVIPLGSALASGMYEKSILSSTDFGKIIQQNIEDWKEAKTHAFDIKSSPDLGNPAAAFQIVEFFDYQCPHCRRASPSLHAFATAHLSDVHLIYQNYPLDKSCNPRGGAHDLACVCARSAICANRQSKFFEAHEWIFDHQDTLTSDSIDQMANEIHLDMNAFHNCMADDASQNQLRAEIDRGNDAELEGTPSVFVNGRLLNGGYLIPVLEAALKASK